MVVNVAIQMDPPATIDIDTDSSFVLGLEAQRRGHQLFTYTPADLSLRGEDIIARARSTRFRRERGHHFEAGEPRPVDLAQMDIVLMRQDPPFDMAYITATHILERLLDRVCIFNDPKEVRNAPEKLFVTRFPDLTPPTLISRDRGEIDAFRREYGDIILKPLYGNGGAGVFHLTPSDENLGSLLETFTSRSAEPLIAQKYLPAVREGDKRIILVDGKPAGALNRVPAAGEARANLHAGGRGERSKLTERDREICAAIGPELSKRDLVFAGIDVIGGYLTEINVTSPTCIQEINAYEDICIESDLWDIFEQRLEKKGRGAKI